HPVEVGPPRPHPAESVIHVLPDDLEPALGCELPKVVQLVLRVLVYGADAHVKGCSLHSLYAPYAVFARLLQSVIRSGGGCIPESRVRRFRRGGSSPSRTSGKSDFASSGRGAGPRRGGRSWTRGPDLVLARPRPTRAARLGGPPIRRVAPPARRGSAEHQRGVSCGC